MSSLTTPESYIDLASTTLTAGYTAGSGVMVVASTSGFPSTNQFHFTIFDQTTNLPKAIGKATAIVTLTYTVVMSLDANANAGDFFVLTLGTGAMNQIRADQQGRGTYANLPTAGYTVGDMYHATDVPFDYYWDGSVWQPQERCSLLSEAKGDYGIPYCASQKNVSVSGSGGVNTLINYSGGSPGYVSGIDLLINGTIDVQLESAVIKIYIDGSGTASVSCPLVNFAGKVLAFDMPATFYSRYTSGAAKSAIILKIPIPFSTGIKITLTNAGTQTYGIYSNIDYVLGIPNHWKGTRVFHCDTAYQQNMTAYSVYNIINYTGGAPGRLLGVSMCFDGNGSASPAFAWAEGPISYTVDGAGSPNMATSGVEDYFGSAGYWANLNGTVLASDNYGVLDISTAGGYAANVYRFHILDPVCWTSTFLMTFTAGILAVVPWSGTGLYYSTAWYYTQS